jgi:hypothetical protein
VNDGIDRVAWNLLISENDSLHLKLKEAEIAFIAKHNAYWAEHERASALEFLLARAGEGLPLTREQVQSLMSDPLVCDTLEHEREYGKLCDQALIAIADRARVQSQQAKIDALILEYCPDEMTPEQVAEWGRNQRAVPESEVEAKLREGK